MFGFMANLISPPGDVSPGKGQCSVVIPGRLARGERLGAATRQDPWAISSSRKRAGESPGGSLARPLRSSPSAEQLLQEDQPVVPPEHRLAHEERRRPER